MSEAIVLAGGKGTRLKPISGETPKPLVMVGGKPFVYWILQELEQQGFSRVVLATGYKSDLFRSQVLKDNPINIEVLFSEEEAPLGTGGAIRNAMEYINEDEFFVFNGDSYCEVSCEKVVAHAMQTGADICVVAMQVDDVSRYGQIRCDDATRVVTMIEKGGSGPGLINSGVYYIKRESMQSFEPDSQFSFEQEVLEKAKNGFYAYISKGYFVDIGIPESYRMADRHFAAQNL